MNNIINIAIGNIKNSDKKGKKISIIIAKAWAENEQVAIFAIHRKKPIIKAKNPPTPSLLKL